MKLRYFICMVAAAAAAMHAPLYATVQIQSMTSSAPTPQRLGTPIVWEVTATDSKAGPLTFQFNVTSPSGATSMVSDFNVGAYSAGVWTFQMSWATIAAEGVYQVQVVAKDFGSGETQTQTVGYRLVSRVTGGNAAVNATANPLVALFSAPACESGAMQVTFQQMGKAVVNGTDWKPCGGNTSLNFYVAGLYPTSTYTMNYQVRTDGTTTPGPRPLSFTTGALPSNIAVPKITLPVPPDSQVNYQQPMIVQSYSTPVAMDLLGQLMWYYSPGSVAILTRPLASETMLAIIGAPAWTTFTVDAQIIREFDLAGNIVHQTNTGVLQQELLALGATDGGPCNTVPNPAPIGAGCLGNFSHEVMRLPNGDTVAMATIEKIFPPGTQGSTSPLPIDIRGDMIVVLDSNWQAIWYWDSFNPAGGGNGYPNLPVSRPATLGEACVSMKDHCGPVFLGGLGTAQAANEWLHGNSIYYMPDSGDFLLSLRNQDWLIKIDYNNGTGTGNVLWRMGNEGDFTFNNLNNDPWPWFSGQHDAGYENNGVGPLTVFDDGNTRRAPSPQGLGTGCEPSFCGSRGMALAVDETNMVVTPVLSQYLGEIASAYGSAQLLSDGSYYFDAGMVQNEYGYCMEVLPTPGTIHGSIIYTIEGQSVYRSFRLSNLYHPPTT